MPCHSCTRWPGGDPATGLDNAQRDFMLAGDDCGRARWQRSPAHFACPPSKDQPMTVAVAVLCHRSTGGGFMAADRQLSMSNGMRRLECKIRCIGRNTLVASAGSHDQTSTVLQNVESRPGVSTAPVIQMGVTRLPL